MKTAFKLVYLLATTLILFTAGGESKNNVEAKALALEKLKVFSSYILLVFPPTKNGDESRIIESIKSQTQPKRAGSTIFLG